MGLHDANIVSFGSWWRRTKRGGLAYALHVVRHGRQSATEWRLRLASIVFWGFGWPLFGSTVALLCWFRSPLAGAAVLAALFGTYAVQMVRIALRKHGAGADWNFALKFGALTMLGKFAQFGGAVRCWNDLILKRESRLIEYKRSA